MSQGNSTNSNYLNEDSFYIYNLYLFSLFTVGASIQKLYGLYLSSNKGLKNKFFILPLITLITATAYIFLDLERAFKPGGLSDTQDLYITIAQFVLDYPSSIALQFALWMRLYILIQAESKLGSFAILKQVIKILLLVPVTWFVPDTIGIIGLLIPKYYSVSVQVVGIYNMAVGLYDITLHSIFIYLFINRIPSVRNRPKFVRKIVIVCIIICANSLGLAFGGIYSFFEGVVGYVIIYAAWLTEVYGFLLLNDLAGKMLKGTKRSHSLDPHTSAL